MKQNEKFYWNIILFLIFLALIAVPVSAHDPSRTTLSSNNNPSTYGTSVTFDAHVERNYYGSSWTDINSGTVEFRDGTTLLSSQSVSSGHAYYTTSSLSVGSHSINATLLRQNTYPDYATSTGLLTQTVNKKPTTTTLGSSLNPSVYSQEVTFTATVSGSTGALDETVTFKDDGTDLVTVGLDPTGVATYPTSALSVGGHNITAWYNGNTTMAASMGVVDPQTVNSMFTTVTVASSGNPSVFGDSVTFTAHVAGFTSIPVTPSKQATNSAPVNVVQFKDNGADLGTPQTLDSDGNAMFTTSDLTVGNHPITADYSGNETWAMGSGTLPGGQTVNQIPTITTLVSSLNPSVFSQEVTFNATVSGSTGQADEYVTFKDDGVDLVTVGLDPTGIATYPTSALPVGAHNITAWYSGNVTMAASMGFVDPQTVNSMFTTVTVTSSLNPSRYSQAVTFTAHVVGSVTAASESTGAKASLNVVQFKDGSNNLGLPVTLDSAGNAIITNSTLTPGNHPITAEYGGNDTWASATGTLPGGQNVYTTKIGVFRNTNKGTWYVDYNGNNSWDSSIDLEYLFGNYYDGDIPVVADWNGDGRLKIGTFQSGPISAYPPRSGPGSWYVDYNGNNKWDAQDRSYLFGKLGDKPVLGDWNNDGIMKIGVFRSGQWIVDYNGNNTWDPSIDRTYTFGKAGDFPVMGDWNNDGLLEIGVFRPSDGKWYVDFNANNAWDNGIDQVYTYGKGGDIPIMGDWNYNGKLEIGVLRNGQWIVDYNGNNAWDPSIDRVYNFGKAGDLPIMGDWTQNV